MSTDLLNDALHRQRIAELSPTKLVWSLYFWSSQYTFIALLIFYIIITIILFPLTYPKSSAIISYLSIFIHVFSFGGMYIGAKAVAEILVEHAIAKEIEERGAKYLAELKSKSSARMELERLEEEFLPNNPSRPVPAMIRLFQQICKQARDRKFESSVLIVEPFKSESLKSIFSIQNLQRMALRLGILGTFIGLILAISHSGFAKDSSNFLDQMIPVFSDLHISFSTSVVGLEASIILGFLLLIIRQRQDAYFRDMESAVVTINSLAYNAINKDDFLAEFARVNESIHQLNDRVFQQINSLEKVDKHVKTQTEHMDKGVETLLSAKDKYDTFLTEMTQAQNAFADKMATVQKEFINDAKEVYDLISLHNLTNEIKEGVIQAGNIIANSIKSDVNTISKQLSQFTITTDDIQYQLGQQSSTFTDGFSKLDKDVRTQTDQIDEGIKRLSAAKSEFDSFINKLVDVQNRFIGDLSSVYNILSIKEMSEEISQSIRSGEIASKQLNANIDHALEKLKRNGKTPQQVKELRESTYGVPENRARPKRKSWWRSLF